MSDRAAVAERLQEFFAAAALMDASIEYTERLIAWSKDESLVSWARLDDVGRRRGPAPCALGAPKP